MIKSNHLTAKDLINVGIYTALYLVVFFVIGLLTSIPFLYPLLLLVLPVATGIPFMLFLTKVNKPGMVFIMSVILGAFWFMIGYTWIPIITYLVYGLISEIIFKAAKYKNFKLLTMGYWVFSLDFSGCQMPMWLMTDSYMKYITDSMGTQYAEKLSYYMPWWMGIAEIGLIFVGAILGALLGRKMLKKHFKRAGIA